MAKTTKDLEIVHVEQIERLAEKDKAKGLKVRSVLKAVERRIYGGFSVLETVHYAAKTAQPIGKVGDRVLLKDVKAFYAEDGNRFLSEVDQVEFLPPQKK